MSQQPEIQFNSYHRENNIASQQYLNENMERFNRQMKLMYDLLMKGIGLTRLIAMQEYKIMDLARRKKDLKTQGVSMHDDKKIEGLQVVYMTDEDKRLNELKFRK